MTVQNDSKLIIGVGNEFRNDDAAGIIVSRIIKDKIGNKVKVIEQNGDGASLIEALNNKSTVILIDSVSFGSPTGTIHFIDVNKSKIPNENSHHSSHLFSVADAIETARELKKLPSTFHIYGIEGKSFEFGTVLSREVLIAAYEVSNKIISYLTV